ncbi:MAG TPA: hypothetical protein DEP13_08200 [Gammaproteobacteria bacterium]|nr:hypothetical protein [Gammaproteobacteria bacterium]
MHMDASLPACSLSYLRSAVDELHSLAQAAQTWPIEVDPVQVRTITALLNEAERTLGRPVPPQPSI